LIKSFTFGDCVFLEQIKSIGWREEPAFGKRVGDFIRNVTRWVPFVQHTRFIIHSSNTFPHSSGIASSASAMGSLALCLVQAEEEITRQVPGDGFMNKVSFLARLGSGSACRSVYPSFAVWGASEAWPGSSDLYAVPAAGNEVFRDMQDSILVVDAGTKQVSSSAGHGMMEGHPFAETRFRQAIGNMSRLKQIMEQGNWSGMIELMEEEALSLHAMMMTGSPGYLLMKPGTLSILQKIREFRRETGAAVGFTLDAGANVHLLYPGQEEGVVQPFIKDELAIYCEDGRVIHDGIGEGPKKPDS
jgi:diphosphomevalonate decarboxylase